MTSPPEENVQPPGPAGEDASASRQDVESRAYAKWLEKGRPAGTHVQDWLEAELELKQAREALGESRERFQSLIQIAGSVIVCLTPDQRIREWNQAAERVHGWSKQQALGQDYLQLCVPPARRAGVAANIQDVLAGPPTVHFENFVLTRDRGERLLGWNAARLVNAAGQPTELILIGQDITERRQVEEVGRERETHFRLLVEQMPAVIWTTDTELRFTSSQGGGLVVLGLQPNQHVGQSLFEFFQTDDPETLSIAAHLRALRGESLSYDEQWSGRTYHAHLEPLYNRDGVIVGTVGVALDVTERKSAEEALRQAHADLEGRVAERTAELRQANEVLKEHIRERERAEEAIKNSEALYHSLVENLPQNIFRKDREGRFTFGNERFCATLGKPLADILGKTDFDFYTQALAAKYRQDDERVMASGKIFESVEEHTRPDGAKIFVQVVKTPVRDFRGDVVGIQGLFWDVTERKRAEEALREREERLQLALEGGCMGTWDWDLDSGAVRWSRSFEPSRGLPPYTFTGTLDSFLRDIHADDREAVAQALARAVAQGTEHHIEYRVVWPDGSIHWEEGRGRPFADAGGKVRRVLGICADITERKRSEERNAAGHAVTRALAESATLLAAAPKVLQALCDSLGWDVGAIWSADPAANVLRCVAVWPPPQGEAAEQEPWRRVSSLAPGMGLPGCIWAVEKPLWIADVAGAPGAAFAGEGLHGAFGFPIRSASKCLGVLEFYCRRCREPDEDQLRTMTSIGSQIGQFMEHREAEHVLRIRMEKFQVARKIQQGLLPQAPPVLPGFEVAGMSWPADETGGDYFDYFPLPGSRLGIVIGDVSGHGIGAALLMAETRAYLRALGSAYSDISRILDLANRHLVEDVAGNYFVTLILAELDPHTRSLVYTSAGHPTGYLLDRRGEVKAVLPSTGIPLGIDPDSDYPVAAALTLGPGDLLLLLTDGLLEIRSPDGTWFGTERTLDVVRANHARSAQEIVLALQDAVRDFVPAMVLSDDITLIVLKVTDS